MTANGDDAQAALLRVEVDLQAVQRALIDAWLQSVERDAPQQTMQTEGSA